MKVSIYQKGQFKEWTCSNIIYSFKWTWSNNFKKHVSQKN